jgi:hypothetical protein
MIVFAELYAGLAAVSLHLCGLKPPVSRIGAKTGYAGAIVRELGITRADVRKFLLVDSDPSVVAVLRTLVCPEGRAFVARRLRSWPHTRKCWEDLRKIDLNIAQYVEAARWLYVTAGARGGIGGFKGKHKLRPSVNGFIPTIDSLASRVEALDLDPDMFDIRHARAESIRPFKGAIVYLDPPYAGRQGYSSSFGTDACSVYTRWVKAGARVALSEGQRLTLQGSRVVNLSNARRGQLRRSLTRSSHEYLHVSGTQRGYRQGSSLQEDVRVVRPT